MLEVTNIAEADEDGYISSEFDGDSEVHEEDATFLQIKQSVITNSKAGSLISDEQSVSSLVRDTSDENSASSGHCSLVYGFIPKGCYEHPIKNGAILGSMY